MTKGKVESVRYDRAGAQPRTRTSRLHKSGNSLGIYVPKEMAEQLRLVHLSEVRLYIVAGVLCVEPVRDDLWRPAVVEAETAPAA